jgi:MFS family permease
MGDDAAVPGDTTRQDRPGAQEGPALRLALLGLAGASIEWYDFFIYATAAALVFPRLFFSETLPPLVALIASFSTFAVGFVARPAGAVLFGHLGDRVGRKAAFAAALITMGAATTLIGVLPSYHAMGVLAPIALVLLRFTQGLAVGGQWGGAILLAIESAPKSRRGLYGSIVQASVPLGVVLANLAFLVTNAVMSPAAFMAYGWRIPFLGSIALVGLGIFIQVRLADTVAFRQLRASARAPPKGRTSPVFEVLRSCPRLILIAGGAGVGNILAFYILITYVVAYGTSAAGLQLPRGTMLGAVLIAQIATAPVTCLAGMVSDRYGRRHICMTGVALMGVWAFVLFPLLETRSPLWITVAISVGFCVLSLTYGPLAALFAETFSTRVRYSAVSLAYQIAGVVGGGLAPIIATALFARFHSNLSISIYIAAACALSWVCLGMLKSTHHTQLDDYAEPALAKAVDT